MRVTRFPQSCMVIEADGKSIVIDPGSNFLESHRKEELEEVSAVFYTHKHRDHYEPNIAAYLLERGIAVYANRDSALEIADKRVHIVEDGEEFEVAGFQVLARELPHCPMPDGGAGPQNTGYVINNTLFHPGDGKELKNFRIDNLALPIQGPDLSFRDAFDFAKQVQAKVVIPIHYDKMGAKPEIFKQFGEAFKMPFEVRVLSDGDSTEL